MPVVTASAEPDMVTTSTTGPAVSAQPTTRYRGIWTRWSSHSSNGPIVITIEGSTQSERPAAMTMTGSTKAATSSMTVAAVTDRSIRRASGRPVGARCRP